MDELPIDGLKSLALNVATIAIDGLGLLTLNVAAASVVVGLVALAASRLSRRASMPLQHGILCIALLLMLVSPVSAWLCIRWNVGLLPVDLFAMDLMDLEDDSHSVEDLTIPFEFPKASNGDHSVPRESISTDLDITHPDELPDEIVASNDSTTPSESFLEQLIAASATVPIQVAGTLFLIAWTIGVLWKSHRLVSGLLVVRSLRRSLHPSSDPRVAAEALRVFAASNTRRIPAIAESPLAPAPLTLGWGRPVIVIPEGLANTLSEEQLACILAHELAHVQRYDVWVAFVQEFAAVIFWWNPLLRAINRHIRQLRERLCDDFAVLCRNNSVTLAQALVHVAEWSAARPRPARFTTGLLDHFNDLEERIQRLTEPGRTVALRWSTRSAAGLCAFGMLASALMALPILRPYDYDTGGSFDFDVHGEFSWPSSAEISVERALDRVPRPSEEPADVSLSGHVRTTDKKPVAGAKVYLLSLQGDDPREDPNQPLAVTRTDASGRYKFSNIPLPMSGNPEMRNRFGIFQVCAERDDFGMAWTGSRYYYPQPRSSDLDLDLDPSANEREFYQGEPIELDLTLQPARSLSGRIVDEQGKAISGTTITLRDLDYLDTRNHEHHPNTRMFGGLCLMPARFREAQSDAEGRFEIPGLPPETVAHLIIEHPEFATQWLLAAITDSLTTTTENRYSANGIQTVHNDRQVSLPMWETRTVRPSPVEIQFRRVREVLVEVVHPEDGTPASDVSVSATTTFLSSNSEAMAHGMTDEEGHVTLRLPPGKYHFRANPKRDSHELDSTHELVVEDQPDEQTFKAPLTKGCLLILEVVDAATGRGIQDVRFTKGRGSRGIMGQGTSFRTDANGQCRALVPAGSHRYAVELGSVPNPGRTMPFDYREVSCEPGKTARLRFEILR